MNAIDEMVAIGSITDQAADFPEASVGDGLNILVASGTQTGKTTAKFGHPTGYEEETSLRIVQMAKGVWGFFPITLACPTP